MKKPSERIKEIYLSLITKDNCIDGTKDYFFEKIQAQEMYLDEEYEKKNIGAEVMD